jgi:hypothetical protein
MFISEGLLMESRIRYQRSFLIFNQEDPGYGAVQDPSGHVKIEVQDGKGKLLLLVYNLREDQEKVSYLLYIIKYSNSQVVPVRVGQLPVNKNKVELLWEFDPQNVNMTGLSIDEFNIAAVVVQDKGKNANELICPLAAYKGEKVQWRDKVRDILYPVKIVSSLDAEDKEILKKQDIFSKSGCNIVSRYYGLEKPDKGVQIEDNKTVEESVTDISQKEAVQDAKETEPEIAEEKPLQSNLDKPESSDNNFLVKNPDGAFEGAGNTGIVEKNNALNREGSIINPCTNCQIHNLNNNEKTVQVDLVKLRERFDMSFEVFNPFRSSRKSYMWWKVNNPTNLNNILFSFGLKNPLLFSPRVLMAYYKYRHLAVGIYDEPTGGKKYIVCGIPGVCGIDDRPFAAACKWIQIEGTKPRYGAFGYWLVYMDIKTGKLIG